ncbi:MAG: hypothetical protein JST40_13080 [Armatimonadetes bacterium]|nr:hypothetical protein [Armatimonadota bacterium]
MALIGPSGWGKTSLLQCVSNYRCNQKLGTIGIRSLRTQPVRWEHLETVPVLILDDAGYAFRSPRAKHDLRMLLERRAKAGRSTIIAIETDLSTKALRNQLPYSRNWSVGEITEPTKDEFPLMVRHFAKNYGLHISETLISLLAKKLTGNGHALVGALQRLQLVQLSWLTLESVAAACGVLNENLSAADGWDIRDHIVDLIDSAPSTRSTLKSSADRIAFAAFVMRKAFRLPEREVAGYLGLDEGRVYNLSNRVMKGEIVSEPAKILEAWLSDFERSLESV